jgi:tetratricopeptide (TPR) repeat protein
MLAGIYVRQNRLDAAIITYERMLPITGNDASVLMSLGKLYYQQQKFSQAADYFKQAVAQLSGQNHQGLNDEQATAHFYYGVSLEASHQWQDAVPQYQMLKPEHDLYLDAQLRLANIDINQKHFDDAEARLLKLQTSFKDNLAVYEMLSGLRLQQKQYQDVISESDKAVDLGYSQILLFNRAVAFEKLKTYKQLDAALDTILGREPNNAETLNFYGYSLADRGVRLKDAQRMVEKALNIRPDDGYYLDSLAWVFFKKKEYDKALKLQLDAVEVIKNDPVMMEHLGDIYWQNKEENQAKTSWQRAVDLGHDKPEQVKLKIKRGLL